MARNEIILYAIARLDDSHASSELSNPVPGEDLKLFLALLSAQSSKDYRNIYRDAASNILVATYALMRSKICLILAKIHGGALYEFHGLAVELANVGLLISTSSTQGSLNELISLELLIYSSLLECNMFIFDHSFLDSVASLASAKLSIDQLSALYSPGIKCTNRIQELLDIYALLSSKIGLYFNIALNNPSTPMYNPINLSTSKFLSTKNLTNLTLLYITTTEKAFHNGYCGQKHHEPIRRDGMALFPIVLSLPSMIQQIHLPSAITLLTSKPANGRRGSETNHSHCLSIGSLVRCYDFRLNITHFVYRLDQNMALSVIFEGNQKFDECGLQVFVNEVLLCFGKAK